MDGLRLWVCAWVFSVCAWALQQPELPRISTTNAEQLDARSGNWSDYIDFHAGSCRSAQALTENLVLSLLGGVAGLGVAFAGTSLILHFAFATTTAVPISASPSMPVLLFAFGITFVTGITFGITPAWMATHVDPVEALRGVNRSTPRAGSLSRRTLVVLQAALSLVLLSASGLLTGALRNLEHHNFGFERDGRIVINVDPVLAGYKPEQLDLLYRRGFDCVWSISGRAVDSGGGPIPRSSAPWHQSI